MIPFVNAQYFFILSDSAKVIRTSFQKLISLNTYIFSALLGLTILGFAFFYNHILFNLVYFIVFPVSNCRKIYYIPYYVGQSQNGINRTYNFSDGSELKLDLSTKKRQEYADMLDLVLVEKEQLKWTHCYCAKDY